MIFDNYLPEGHLNPDKITIGTINFDLEVYSNEGQIPHFHMYNDNKSFNTCHF